MSEVDKRRTRILKVVEGWDFRGNQPIAQVRLQGKWLEKAGLIRGKHVKISNPKPGVLILRMQYPQETMEEQS